MTIILLDDLTRRIDDEEVKVLNLPSCCPVTFPLPQCPLFLSTFFFTSLNTHLLFILLIFLLILSLTSYLSMVQCLLLYS